jgi:hypothetical protein
MWYIDVVLGARVFANLITRFTKQPLAFLVNRFGIKLRIGHDHIDMEMSNIGAIPTFNNLLFVAVRIGILIRPSTFLLEGD